MAGEKKETCDKQAGGGKCQAEELFKTLKCEEVYLCEYEALGYLSPNGFEESPFSQQNNGAPPPARLS